MPLQPSQSSKPKADLTLEKKIVPAIFSVLTFVAGSLLLSNLILQRRSFKLGKS